MPAIISNLKMCSVHSNRYRTVFRKQHNTLPKKTQGSKNLHRNGEKFDWHIRWWIFVHSSPIIFAVRSFYLVDWLVGWSYWVSSRSIVFIYSMPLTYNYLKWYRGTLNDNNNNIDNDFGELGWIPFCLFEVFFSLFLTEW